MSARAASLGVPPFLTLAAHPIRWQLLRELARSDLQVGELTRAVGEPQGLVSYHLGLLRAGGLVSSHKSSFDRRAAYYRLHLDRCGDLLTSTATALHPGLSPDAGAAPGRRSSRSVLFLCTGNGARSQIAEALLRHRAGDEVEVASAGSHPKPVHPLAVRVLAERGVDISGARSKPLTDFSGRSFDHVITLCDKVREVCPEYPGNPHRTHWSIEDPSRSEPGRSAAIADFRTVADDLDTRVRLLIARFHTEEDKENIRHDR